MRAIGRLDSEQQARTFSDCLHVRKIENEVDDGGDGGWIVWVHSEDEIEEARDLLERFTENPDEPDFAAASRQARKLAVTERKKAARSRTRHVDVRTTWGRPAFTRPGILTTALIAISVAVSVLTKLGTDGDILRHLSMTGYDVADGYIRWMKGLPEIREGQVWRLFTPMFIHYGIMHILFNMLWLKDLGGVIESREGPLRLGLLVFVIAALSNAGQYLATGPSFGGMSGVVFGLLGYVWMRGKFDPRSGYHVEKWIVVMMTVWFFLGFFGLIGNIANVAHGVGFGLGIAWGFLAARRRSAPPGGSFT